MNYGERTCNGAATQYNGGVNGNPRHINFGVFASLIPPSPSPLPRATVTYFGTPNSSSTDPRFERRLPTDVSRRWLRLQCAPWDFACCVCWSERECPSPSAVVGWWPRADCEQTLLIAIGMGLGCGVSFLRAYAEPAGHALSETPCLAPIARVPQSALDTASACITGSGAPSHLEVDGFPGDGPNQPSRAAAAPTQPFGRSS